MLIAPYSVPLTALSGKVDPLGGALWGCKTIQISEVHAAVSANDYEYRAWDQVKDELYGPSSRDFHIRRVAYFVRHGWPEDEHRIRLAVDGTDTNQPVRIDNGNHRLAAAMIREDVKVKALLFFFDQADVHLHLPGAQPV